VDESRRKRILVVEDEPLVAMLLEDMMSDLGFEVVGPALRFERAVELVESEALDAAILDVNLGDRRSYPVAEMLVARGVPFVFATGYGSAGTEWEPRVPILRKPFQAEVVSSVMFDLLGGPPRPQ
jgi:CheY-like chemotaxis protein